MRAIRNIVIHCSASPNGRDVSVEEIDRWHAARGFNRRPAAIEANRPNLKHIGYHHVIEIDGTMRFGRAHIEIGAHVAGSNADSIGICMIGTDKFTAAQWASLAQLHTDLSDRYVSAIWLGHRDFSPDLNGDGIIQPQEWLKTCPGFDVNEWLRRGRMPLLGSLLGAA